MIPTKTRGAKPGSGGKKRKAPEDLSANPHTKKARDRLEAMTPVERQVENAKTADRTAVTRAKLALKSRQAYQDATPDVQAKMLEDVAETTMTNR